MTNWCTFLLNIFGCQDYKQQYEVAQELYEATLDMLGHCNQRVGELEDENGRLKLITPHPIPPKITNIGEVNSTWIDTKLAPLKVIRFPLDGKYRLTDKTNFLNIVAWDWVDSIAYQKDIYDCENFAISFKAHVDYYFGLNQVGIVIDYTSGHGYNLVVFPNGKVMLLEPQSDGLVYWEDRITILYALEDAFVLI